MRKEALVIGEAGVNHNGSEELAMKLADVAFRAQVDIVKYQIFQSDQLATKLTPKAEYQSTNTVEVGSQQEMLSKLELSFESHKRIAKYCKSIGLQYLSTAFDFESLEYLAEEIAVPMFKISSGDLTNAPFLLAHARYKRNIILSSGMSTLGEIEEALGVIAFGLLDSEEAPSDAAFRSAYRSNVGQAMLKKHITLLHCTTEYPTEISEINMTAMNTMHQAFGLDVGFSDHSIGDIASAIAVGFGARVIEKHFTLDKKMDGPDHKASMSPDELVRFVCSMRNAGLCLGDGIKRPASSEIKNIPAARRSLVATADIGRGELFTDLNVGVMRPGSGSSPFRYWEVLGSPSNREYSEGELI